MSAAETVQLIVAAIPGIAGAVASVIAAIKAGRAEATSKKTEERVTELKLMITQVQNRQVQNVSINLGTGGAAKEPAKGGEVIDLSPEGRPPVEG